MFPVKISIKKKSLLSKINKRKDFVTLKELSVFLFLI